MNSSSFCSAIWLAGLKRKSALSANCSGWRPLQGMESRAPLDNFSPLIFTALPRSAQSTRSSWNINSRFIQFGFANLLLAYQPPPQSLQATWSREHYAIFFLFSSSHQPDSPPESDEFRACHFQVIAGMFLRMRAFFTSSFVEPHQIRTWQEPSETWVTLCYVSMHTLHTLTCASLYPSSSFLLQVRLKTLQLGRLKDSSNNLLALKGCTTSASICGNWHPLADHILPLSLSNNSEMGQQVWHCSFKVRQTTKQGDSQSAKAMPH